MSAHVEHDWLERYARGELDQARSFSVEAHLPACAACRAAVTRLVDATRIGAHVGRDRPGRSTPRHEPSSSDCSRRVGVSEPTARLLAAHSVAAPLLAGRDRHRDRAGGRGRRRAWRPEGVMRVPARRAAAAAGRRRRRLRAARRPGVRGRSSPLRSARCRLLLLRAVAVVVGVGAARAGRRPRAAGPRLDRGGLVAADARRSRSAAPRRWPRARARSPAGSLVGVTWVVRRGRRLARVRRSADARSARGGQIVCLLVALAGSPPCSRGATRFDIGGVADDPAISARPLDQALRAQAALAGVTLDIGRGVTGLLGPNGAGKTTLLRIAGDGAAARAAASCGCSARDPRDAAERTEIRRRLGYLPQEPGLPPALHRVRVRRLHRDRSRSWADRGARHDEVRRVLRAVEPRRRRAQAHPHAVGRHAPPRRRWPRHCSATRSCSCSTSRPPGSIPSSGCASASWSPSAAERARSLLSTHQTEDVAALCARVVVLRDGAVALRRHARRARRGGPRPGVVGGRPRPRCRGCRGAPATAAPPCRRARRRAPSSSSRRSRTAT